MRQQFYYFVKKIMCHFDITILTDKRYIETTSNRTNNHNAILEDQLLMNALIGKGLKVTRTNWDNPEFDWKNTEYAMIRSTWDIYDDGNFHLFTDWLHTVSTKTKLINPIETIIWNIDKRYLVDLENRGIAIPPTLFIEKGNTASLRELVQQSGWVNPILKPAISGGGRHTYHLNNTDLSPLEHTFANLIKEQPMLLQAFQGNIKTKGEITLMVFGGKYSHAVLKKVQPGEFRIQDEFGGTVHHYEPSQKEIEFAENAVKTIDPTPIQARVDFIWDNDDQLCVSELELIEPELWFRNDRESAGKLGTVIINAYFNTEKR